MLDLFGTKAKRRLKVIQDNCERYANMLDEWEVPPNGDDFNNLYGLAMGAVFADPHRRGR